MHVGMLADLQSFSVSTVLVFAAIGAFPAVLFSGLDRRVAIKRAERALTVNRAALVDESAILDTLDPNSEAAVALRRVIEIRVNSYLGLNTRRPKLLAAILWAVVFAIGASFMASVLSRATTPPDVAVDAAFLGFSATMSALVTLSILGALWKWKRQSSHQADPRSDSEMAPMEADSVEASKSDA